MTEPCHACGGNYPSYYPPPNGVQPCSSTPCSCSSTDASCVPYTGPKLVCMDVEPNTSVEDILQVVDTKLCSIEGGDWSTFDYHCLSEDLDITTAAQFVDAMTSAYCDFKEEYDTFVDTTYTSQIQSLQDLIATITNPGLDLCSASGITSSDTYTSILTKLSNKICELSTVDYTSANWRTCFTVPTLPTTIIGSLNVLLDQICQVKASVGVVTLPTFNNTGSCLASPGSADSLVDTINKMKTRLCQSVTYSIIPEAWTCLGAPVSFQGVVDALLEATQNLILDNVTFDSEFFAVTADGCNGRTVTMQEGFSGTDRLVASDDIDTEPGTLADKLEPGTNITLDNTTTPGKIIINSTAVDQKVKVNASDSSTGFLEDKIVGASTPGVANTKTTSVGNDQVVITPTLDFNYINNQWFDVVESNEELYARFCALICGCRPCQEGGTPITPNPRRVRVRIINNHATSTFTNTYTFTQNSPTLGWIDDKISIAPSHTYQSGWYDVSSSTSVLTSLVKIINSESEAQNINVRALQPGNTVIPGSSAFVGALGTDYTNAAYSLGSLLTDITLEIQLS